MNFNWFLDAVKSKYADFNGRARRQEYWMYILVYFIILFIAAIIDNFIGKPIIFSVVYIALFVPTLAVAVRRLHDVGKSGWFLFAGLIPVVGAFLVIFNLIQEGTPGSNEYGANPKEVSNQ